MINGYDGAIQHVDALVKQLVDKLEHLGSWERTTLVLTADHGEGLGQHDFLAHALVWREQLRVPLIVRAPGRAAERRDELMSSIDLLPTVVDLTPGLPGEELLAQARGRSVVAAEFEPRPVFSISPSSQNEFALTLSRWKFIHRPKGRDALFDLQEDPNELRDRSADEPKIAATLKELLMQSMKEQRARHTFLLRGAKLPPISAEDEAKHLEALKKLGYVDGAGDR
jgi:arylsulfatase A-like enzyme